MQSSNGVQICIIGKSPVSTPLINMMMLRGSLWTHTEDAPESVSTLGIHTPYFGVPTLPCCIHVDHADATNQCHKPMSQTDMHVFLAYRQTGHMRIAAALLESYERQVQSVEGALKVQLFNLLPACHILQLAISFSLRHRRLLFTEPC